MEAVQEIDINPLLIVKGETVAVDASIVLDPPDRVKT
jgi:succinyl-CoA synthetase beta subunit